MKYKHIPAFVGFIITFFLTALFFYLSNLIPLLNLKYSYSPDNSFRYQTYALMQGHLSISTDPTHIRIDNVYYNGKIQQVWGLGVPLLHLPFQAVAELFNIQPLPDRLLLWFYFNLTFFIVFISFFKLCKERKYKTHTSLIFSTGIVLSLMFLLPIFNLPRVRFIVYEESILYTYLVTLLLFCGALRIKASRTLIIMLFSFCAGLTALFRPTAVIYGALSIGLLLKKEHISKQKSALMFIAFILGVSAVGYLNLIRFGALGEFGHGLNVNALPVLIYQLKFDYVFKNISIVEASRHFFGLIFFNYSFLNSIPSSWWKTPTYWWTENYINMFTVPHLILWGTSVLMLMLSLIKKIKQKSFFYTSELFSYFYFWSTFSFIGLMIFYIHAPAMSSRYIVDFGAGIGIGIAGFILHICFYLYHKKPLYAYGVMGLFSIAVMGLTFHEVSTTTTRINAQSLSHVKTVVSSSKLEKPLGYRYRRDNQIFSYNIIPNGNGWNNDTGTTSQAISIYIQNPHYLKLRFSGETQGFPLFYSNLGIKIGNDTITPLSYKTVEPHLFDVYFSIPSRYQNNIIWPVFIKFLSVEDSSIKDNNDYLLESIQWRNNW